MEPATYPAHLPFRIDFLLLEEMPKDRIPPAGRRLGGGQDGATRVELEPCLDGTD